MRDSPGFAVLKGGVAVWDLLLLFCACSKGCSGLFAMRNFGTWVWQSKLIAADAVACSLRT